MIFSTIRTISVGSSFSLFVAVLAAFCSLFLNTPANAQQQKKDQPEKPTNVNVNYRIGPGDVIDIAVAKQEMLSKTGVRVNDEGMIQLTYLDEDIPAACRTERELADEIREKYKKYILNPYVNVAVKEFNSNQVAFIGAVNSPGRFQLQRPVKLLELITLVNGPSGNAGRNIQIIRDPNAPRCEQKTFVKPQQLADEEIFNYSLADTLKADDKANPYIRAGDIVRIVEADNVQAFIIGNVKNAQPINLKEPVTLSKAIAMAGGTAPGADLEKIKITREAVGSLEKPAPLIVNLKEINKGKKEDILLQANDVVDVPGPSGSRKILRAIINTVVPTFTRAPVPIAY